MTNRPEYKKVDQEYREAFLSSRNDLMHRASEIDLWVGVMKRAIKDLTLYSELRERRDLSDEEKENFNSAYSFIFDDEHRFPFSDYDIEVLCNKCKQSWITDISKAATNELFCCFCKNNINYKNINYSIVQNDKLKTMSLRELLSLWNINNLESMREQIKILMETATKEGKKKKKAKEPIPKKEEYDFLLTSYTIDSLKLEKKEEQRKRHAAKRKKR